MVKVEMGDVVKIHYEVEFEDGTIFESTLDKEPLKFTTGNNEVIVGLEQAILGMSPGLLKKVKIPYEKGFGPFQKDLVVEIGREHHPYSEPEIGQMVKIVPLNEKLPSNVYRVIDFSESTITFDANHPLAGKDLIYHIQLIDFEKKN
ncbi:MAG: FKBP-type peptidyl-prolyl cis-trans isomerase [Methanosarcinales archaeon]|nr:FKBP-type peptidyl-prolyl cis-trans isomerase [Methanosarcinales archaeon]